MKLSVVVVGACLILGLAACQNANSSGSNAPATATATIPAEYAAFEGVWVGKVDGVMDATFDIRSVRSDGKVFGTYKHGAWPTYGIEPGSTRISGSIVRDLLTLKKFSNGGQWTLVLRDDGAVDATFNSSTGASYARLQKT